MSDRIRIGELRVRSEIGVVVVDEPGEGFEDIVPIAKAELDSLLDALEASRFAVAEAGIVIETLYAGDAHKPYREFSDHMRDALGTSAHALRQAATQISRFDFGDDA